MGCSRARKLAEAGSRWKLAAGSYPLPLSFHALPQTLYKARCTELLALRRSQCKMKFNLSSLLGATETPMLNPLNVTALKALLKPSSRMGHLGSLPELKQKRLAAFYADWDKMNAEVLGTDKAIMDGILAIVSAHKKVLTALAKLIKAANSKKRRITAKAKADREAAEAAVTQARSDHMYERFKAAMAKATSALNKKPVDAEAIREALNEIQEQFEELCA